MVAKQNFHSRGPYILVKAHNKQKGSYKVIRTLKRTQPSVVIVLLGVGRAVASLEDLQKASWRK